MGLGLVVGLVAVAAAAVLAGTGQSRVGVVCLSSLVPRPLLHPFLEQDLGPARSSPYVFDAYSDSRHSDRVRGRVWFLPYLGLSFSCRSFFAYICVRA